MSDELRINTLSLVRQERAKQHHLGFDADHDDCHTNGELAKAVNDFHSSGGAHAHRVSMGDEATQAGAMAVRFLLNLHRFQAPKECAA